LPLNSVFDGHSAAMSWLDRFRTPKPVVEDSVFGHLEWDKRHGCWDGSVAFGASAQRLLLTVYGEAPTESQREAFHEFGKRYSDLAPAIASELLGLYAPHLNEPEEGLPRPANPAEMWEMVELGGLDLHPDGSLVAAYGFREGLGWDDAMFEVGFEDWAPVGKSLGD
jgi:hypothetical protein